MTVQFQDLTQIATLIDQMVTLINAAQFPSTPNKAAVFTWPYTGELVAMGEEDFPASLEIGGGLIDFGGGNRAITATGGTTVGIPTRPNGTPDFSRRVLSAGRVLALHVDAYYPGCVYETGLGCLEPRVTTNVSGPGYRIEGIELEITPPLGARFLEGNTALQRSGIRLLRHAIDAGFVVPACCDLSPLPP